MCLATRAWTRRWLDVVSVLISLLPVSSLSSSSSNKAEQEASLSHYVFFVDLRRDERIRRRDLDLLNALAHIIPFRLLTRTMPSILLRMLN